MSPPVFKRQCGFFYIPFKLMSKEERVEANSLTSPFPIIIDGDRLNYDLYCTFKDHGWWLSQGLEFHYVFQYSRNKSLIHSVHP